MYSRQHKSAKSSSIIQNKSATQPPQMWSLRKLRFTIYSFLQVDKLKLCDRYSIALFLPRVIYLAQRYIAQVIC